MKKYIEIKHFKWWRLFLYPVYLIWTLIFGVFIISFTIIVSVIPILNEVYVKTMHENPPFALFDDVYDRYFIVEKYEIKKER